MNAQYRQDQAPYQHHVEHGPKQPAQPTEPNPLAVHGDPSQHPGTSATDEPGASRHLRWTRPTDLYSDAELARRAVRGVDLHAHLLRIVRDAPIKTIRAARRRLTTPGSAPRHQASAARDGMELS